MYRRLILIVLEARYTFFTFKQWKINSILSTRMSDLGKSLMEEEAEISIDLKPKYMLPSA